jgi:predicted PurR-regulated permease PerM
VAAGLTTVSIMLIVFLPLLVILTMAAEEAFSIYTSIQAAGAGQVAPAEQQEAAGAAGGEAEGEEASAAPTAGEQAPTAAAQEQRPSGVVFLQAALARELVEQGDRVGINIDAGEVERTINAKVLEWLTPLVFGTSQYLGGAVIALAIMVISLYYFLADGPAMVHTVMRLSPLDDRYERQLVEQFEEITRAVVVATLLSALVQGVLAGIGFYFAGVKSVFLLTLLAMLLAMVPFVGSAAVWACGSTSTKGVRWRRPCWPSIAPALSRWPTT